MPFVKGLARTLVDYAHISTIYILFFYSHDLHLLFFSMPIILNYANGFTHNYDDDESGYNDLAYLMISGCIQHY